MKQLTFLIFLLFCFSTGLKAQLWGNLLPSRYMFGPRNLTLDKIQGSPYLSQDFINGKVWTVDGKTFNNVLLRYNCYSDIIEFNNQGTAYDILPKDQVSKVELGDKVFRYLEFQPGYGEKKSYFQILSEGKAILCVKYHISFLEREELRGFSTPKPDRFDELNTTYWISVNESPAKEVVSKSKLLDILSDKKNEIDAFLSSQKLSYKKIDDLKKIINYYNSL